MKNIPIKQVPLIVFCTAFTKSLIFGVTWPEVGMAVVIAGLAFLYEFRVRDKENEENAKKFKELEDRIIKQDTLIEENRAYITDMKLNNPRRSGNNGFRL